MLNLNTSQMKDNMDMEMRLIGKIMSNPRDYYDCHSLISEEIFTDPLNRKIKWCLKG
jgi:hypothetical protein